MDLAPEWAQEVMVDEHLVELSPYPASRVGASGFIGYSGSAGRVLVVIAYRDLEGELHGMNAWPASGRDLALYKKAVADDEEA
ncbi:transposase [Pseudonocardia spinosispora]|uniref:transposase n=1 Tax=Pseudonocardia spinosispora TaxID=103441 RepID=UPI0012EC3F4A|nr:transposase [Pseudonocardia spinosispora]